VPASQLERDVTSHAVAYHDRLGDAELVAQPRQIVGEPGHCVLLHGLIAGAMATQIDSDDAMGATEVLELGGQVRMVPAPAVHQQRDGSPTPASVYARATPSRESRSNTPPFRFLGVLACRASSGGC
jgi:hypothetical protein